MRLTASDFTTYFRPSQCELRVWLRHRGEAEQEPGVFDEVLRRLGEKHEREHLATLGPYLDLSQVGEEGRIRRTLEAITEKVPLLYQPAFRVTSQFEAIEAEVIGIPDFLILCDGGYVVRDAKMSRRIDEKNHPEIILQVQLYGWLFETTCGVPPTALQVFSGTKEIISIPYDGGKSALERLERLVKVKQREGEAYEPVGWSKCTPCGFTARCWARAEAADDPALLPDVDQGLARKLNNLGIQTRKDLLARFNFVNLSELRRSVGNREQRVGKKAQHILQFAEAMEEQKPRTLAPPAIPQRPNYVMVDFEGMPPHLDEIEKIYLWGAQVFGEKPSEFMAAVSGFGPDGDREGWLAFLKNSKRIFALYGDIPFVHWASYEKTHLLKYIQRYGDADAIAARVIANLLDLLTVARDSLILPVPSFSLKVIEQYVGYKRKQEEYGGQWAMATFIEATETCDEEKRQRLMAEILAYNKEDLEATWEVFQWVRNVGNAHT